MQNIRAFLSEYVLPGLLVIIGGIVFTAVMLLVLAALYYMLQDVPSERLSHGLSLGA
jgi:hypothetical protein